MPKKIKAWGLFWKGSLQDEDPFDRVFIYRIKKGALQEKNRERLDSSDEETVVLPVEIKVLKKV